MLKTRNFVARRGDEDNIAGIVTAGSSMAHSTVDPRRPAVGRGKGPQRRLGNEGGQVGEQGRRLTIRISFAT